MGKQVQEMSHDEHNEQDKASPVHKIDPSNHPKFNFHTKPMIEKRLTLNARSSICNLVNFNGVSKLIYCALRLAVL